MEKTTIMMEGHKISSSSNGIKMSFDFFIIISLCSILKLSSISNLQSRLCILFYICTTTTIHIKFSSQSSLSTLISFLATRYLIPQIFRYHNNLWQVSNSHTEFSDMIGFVSMDNRPEFFIDLLSSNSSYLNDTFMYNATNSSIPNDLDLKPDSNELLEFIMMTLLTVILGLLILVTIIGESNNDKNEIYEIM